MKPTIPQGEGELRVIVIITMCLYVSFHLCVCYHLISENTRFAIQGRFQMKDMM